MVLSHLSWKQHIRCRLLSKLAGLEPSTHERPSDSNVPIFFIFFPSLVPPLLEFVTEEQPAGPGHITPRQKLERVHQLGQASRSMSRGRLDRQDSIPGFKARVLHGTERSSRQTVGSSSSLSTLFRCQVSLHLLPIRVLPLSVTVHQMPPSGS